MSEKLIPCPHCGAEAVKGTWTFGEFYVCPAVKTGKCTNVAIYDTRDAWQNQPTPPRIAELEGEVERLKKKIAIHEKMDNLFDC